MFTVTTVYPSQVLFWKATRPWALTLTAGSFPHPEQLHNSPTVCRVLGSNLQNELAPDNSFLELFSAHTYRVTQKAAAASTVEIPPGHWLPLVMGTGRLWGGFLHRPLRVQRRSASTSASPEAPQGDPVLHQCSNRLLSVVFVSRRRLWWGSWWKGLREGLSVLSFCGILDNLYFLRIACLSSPMAATSFEVPFGPSQKLWLSNKGVGIRLWKFRGGKELRENSICVHTLTVWILHYLFQQINLRPDQFIKYRDDIDLSGGICQLQNASCPFLLIEGVKNASFWLAEMKMLITSICISNPN